MSPQNQLTADALRAQLESLTTQREIAKLQVDIRELTQAAEQGRIVQEAFGDFVNPIEYLYDDPSFATANPFGPVAIPMSRRDDRTDGRFRPVYENEQQLTFIRGAAHVLTTMFGSGINILENLNNYTIGDGFDCEVKASEDYVNGGQQSQQANAQQQPTNLPQQQQSNPLQPNQQPQHQSPNQPPQKTATPTRQVDPNLIAAADRVLKTFFDENDWKADMETECHARSRADGEAFLILRPRGWRTEASFAEPDQVMQPADPRQLEEWLQSVGLQLGSHAGGEFVSSWSFGVHTRACDTSRPLGFHVVRDGAGVDWEYYPANDVPLAMRLKTGLIEQIKRNVPRNCKRGVSDYYPVWQHLKQNEQLLHNTEQGGAIQAAIAFIREHAPGVTGSGISQMRSNSATDIYQQSLQKGGTRTAYRQKFMPGTVIDAGYGQQYKYGPMGQSSAPDFIQIIQAAFRYAGARWAIPEYMLSMDASNNNFASILVAGSPFVTARQADQRFYKSRFHRVCWIALRIAFEAGYFKAKWPDLTWIQFEQMIDLELTPPDITIADELKNAQTKQIEFNCGVRSAKTWRKEVGLDDETEEKNLETERQDGLKQQELQQHMMQRQMTGVENGRTAPGTTPNFGPADLGAVKNKQQQQQAVNGNVGGGAASGGNNFANNNRPRPNVSGGSPASNGNGNANNNNNNRNPFAKRTNESAAPSTTNATNLLEHIEQLPDGKWRLWSKSTGASGKRRNLGTFTTKDDAENHERQVEHFKTEVQESLADDAVANLAANARKRLARKLLSEDYP